jgi:hypothetical protein
MTFRFGEDRRRSCLAIIGSLLIGLCLLGPIFLAMARESLIGKMEDEAYLLLLFGTLLLGHLLVAIGARRRRLRSLGFVCLTLSLLGAFPVYAFWAAPPVEFHRLAMAGICSLLLLVPALGILSIVTVVLSVREVLSHSVEVGRCSKCGYNLSGLRDPRCPECGTPFDPSMLTGGGGHGTRSEVSDD